MAKDWMSAARGLIEQKRYDEAKALLEDINHPIAISWLKRLDTRVQTKPLSPTHWQVSQNLVVSKGAMAALKCSRDDIQFLGSIQRRVIEDEVKAASSEAQYELRRLAEMRVESFFTEAMDIEGEVYAVSVPVRIAPAAGSSHWKTILCLDEELEDAKADLELNCIPQLVAN